MTYHRFAKYNFSLFHFIALFDYFPLHYSVIHLFNIFLSITEFLFLFCIYFYIAFNCINFISNSINKIFLYVYNKNY